ncbi:hypothetical protein [Pseudomonas sp. PS02302]|uniref:hypothetical protein n=1 Tax=Pseudomonas sp. PS02302 TaxID=2991428 RepID=UPI00249CD1C9|nr:hypothetical protein [Pseudomonas sp. PS02302]
MITLNHYQLKSLLESSEMYGDEPTDVQSVIVAYLSADDSRAYAGAGLYSTVEGQDLEYGAYLAIDSLDKDRASMIYEAQLKQDISEWEAVDESIRGTETIACKSRSNCLRPHGSAWNFKVPSEVKSCKSVGNCLCEEYKQSEIQIELETPYTS